MKKNLLILCIIFFITIPVYGLTTFTPRISVTEEITDNLFLTNDNQIEEFIIIPSADLELAITAPAKGLTLSYQPSYSFYKNFSENNTFRQGAQFNAWSDFSRTTRFEISDAFSKTEDPLGEEDSPFYVPDEPPTEPDGIIPEDRLYHP